MIVIVKANLLKTLQPSDPAIYFTNLGTSSSCATSHVPASKFELLALPAERKRSPHDPTEFQSRPRLSVPADLSLSPNCSWQTYPQSARSRVTNCTLEDTACLGLGRFIEV